MRRMGKDPLHIAHSHMTSKSLGLPLRVQGERITPIGTEFLENSDLGVRAESTHCSTLQGPTCKLSSLRLSFQLFLLGLQLCRQSLGLKEAALQRVPFSPVVKHQIAGT